MHKHTSTQKDIFCSVGNKRKCYIVFNQLAPKVTVVFALSIDGLPETQRWPTAGLALVRQTDS